MSILNDLKARLTGETATLALDDIQALILRSRPEPYVGVHAMLHIDDAAGGRDLLRRMAEHVPSAAGWTDDRDAWMGLAISFAGLKALGVPQASLESFPLPFQQGMAQRAEQLRDTGANAPEHWDDAFAPGACHIALTIYARDDAALDVALDMAMTELDRSTGVTLVGRHAFGADADAKNPFGFRDSISQPLVAGSGVAPLPGQERAIAAGEFILGENSETGKPVAMPEPPELGRNGSFVVLRKYESQAGAFNDFIRSQAQAQANGDEELLAAKLVGRWRSGAPLPLAPEHDDPDLGADPQRNNGFDFSRDPRGLVCPHASHMRRLNPRDSQLTIMTDVNIHRIIRRSSTFGPKWNRSLSAKDDNGERGIFFIFISARAYDTIEFFQQEWINRGNFIDLAEERDPVVGLQDTPGTFTMPQVPVRKRIDGVTTFNQLRGGEYLFMPSLGALKWIGGARWKTPATTR